MGWISWLCPGMNLKRWLLLFTVGVLCCALGLALFFNYQFMGYVEELMFRMAYLTTGKYSNTVSMLGRFLFLCIGGLVMIYATRRVIRSVVEAVLPDNNSSLMEKIFTQRKLGRGPAITVIGGGTGLSTLLRGMKYITSNCNAVVTVADDGGSSGRLRKEMGIIPPGDLRNCLVALADREPLMERIMQFRFNDGSPLAGHNFGNLFIAAMAEAEGSMEAGLAATSQILNVRGKVIPSTLSDIRLKAEMTDGTLIEGESEIPKAHKRIRRVGIEPSNVQATSSAVDAIMKADVLILGPGSLYTSVIPNLMVEGIREAVLRSDAVKIYVCNVMTQPGETDGYGAFEHVQALITHAGAQFLDYVIVNDQNVTETQLAQYQLKGSIPVTPDIKKIERLGIKVVPKSLISNKDLVRHNPQKLAQAVISLIYRLRLFGKGLKNELSRLEVSKKCCERAELLGLLRVSGAVILQGRNMGIHFSTENAALARRMLQMLKSNYNVQTEVVITRSRRLKKNNRYQVRVIPSKEAGKALHELQLLPYSDVAERHKLLAKSCCRRSFLRGVFLAGGSVSKPSSDYHLEVVTENEELAKSIVKVMHGFSLPAKITDRKNDFIVYMKEGNSIIDFLSVIGAHNALMEFENVRIVKEMRNNVNRVVNCETANLNKVVQAAVEQLESIRYLEKKGHFGKLPAALRETAELRLENPDASLAELAKAANGKISKSGLNHRLKKLQQIAKELGLEINDKNKEQVD